MLLPYAFEAWTKKNFTLFTRLQKLHPQEDYILVQHNVFTSTVFIARIQEYDQQVVYHEYLIVFLRSSP